MHTSDVFVPPEVVGGWWNGLDGPWTQRFPGQETQSICKRCLGRHRRHLRCRNRVLLHHSSLQEANHILSVIAICKGCTMQQDTNSISR